MLVEAKASEEVDAALVGFGLGESAVDGRVRAKVACMLMNAEREEIVFHGPDAIEAPVGVGDGLDLASNLQMTN